MWIFAKHGFLSVTTHNTRPGIMRVRARVREDLAYYFPGFPIEENTGSDYKYRAYIPRQNVTDAITKMAADIDYPSFKNNIADHDRRILYYIQVWNAMFEMQEALSPNGKRKRYGNHKVRRKEPKVA